MTKRGIVLGWLLPLAAGALVLATLLSGCFHDESAGPQRISGHGLSITLPPDWDGRIEKPGPNFGTVLQAGNFELPADDSNHGGQTLDMLESDSDGIYIYVMDLGPPHPERSNAWVDATLPISVGRSDFGMFSSVGPCAVCKRSLARRWVVLNGHALIILVSFSRRHADDALLAEANKVLASLSVKPAA